MKDPAAAHESIRPLRTTLFVGALNFIGLAGGSYRDLTTAKAGIRHDADLLNHHVALSHSQLEDPLLFLTLLATSTGLSGPG
ncbi:MAG: hypothetical protein U0Z17_11695 [Bacteroidales bacterium]